MRNSTLTLLFFLVLTGCTLQPVEPWERGTLAEQSMQVIPDAMEFQSDEHIYFSREAASGGRAVGGGGCGCN